MFCQAKVAELRDSAFKTAYSGSCGQEAREEPLELKKVRRAFGDGYNSGVRPGISDYQAVAIVDGYHNQHRYSSIF